MRSIWMMCRCLILLLGMGSVGCGAEMIRPRASAEKVGDRPSRALVIGQFDVIFDDMDEEAQAEVHLTQHRVLVGDKDQFFTDHVPTQRRTFALWVYPGVFCYGRPTLGGGDSAQPLGEGVPCAEIPEKDTAYYVGTVVWRISKVGDKIDAALEVLDHREAVLGSPAMIGIYPQTALVSTELDAQQVAGKYRLP